jgi:hypothetical protein
VLNEHYECDGAMVFAHACKLGCEGVASKRLGSTYRSGRSPLPAAVGLGLTSITVLWTCSKAQEARRE